MGAGEESEFDKTTEYVGRAHQGDRQSTEWLVARFSPWLLAQARYRLGSEAVRRVDPEDVVSETWMAALPKLGQLEPRRGRLTPVLMKFLSTVLLYRVKNRVYRVARREGRTRPLNREASSESPDLQISDEITDCVVRTIRAEQHDSVLAALEELAPADRQLIIMRCVEQVSNQTAAMLLAIAPNTAAVRYRRALEKLRRRLPSSLLDELV